MLSSFLLFYVALDDYGEGMFIVSSFFKDEVSFKLVANFTTNNETQLASNLLLILLLTAFQDILAFIDIFSVTYEADIEDKVRVSS